MRKDFGLMKQQAIQSINKINEYFLFPGNIFVSEKPYWVTTILGSCVSVCLWDSERKIGGINHFLLPFWKNEELASFKYGNVAVEGLIKEMIRKGSNIKNVQAKIFGGAAILQKAHEAKHIGLKNIAIAKMILESNQLPIVASDVGGRFGRRIKFNTYSGIVLVKKIIETKKRN